MCVICDGGSEEELLADEFVRMALDGYVMVSVEPEPTWAYTIGLLKSFDHPELVVTGLSDDTAAHVMSHFVARIRKGERFTTSSPPVPLCNCTTATFGTVHPAQWDRGRFDHWLRYYGWAGDPPPIREAVQVLWDIDGRYPPDRDFCPAHRGTCQPLLDEPPRHDVNADRFP